MQPGRARLKTNETDAAAFCSGSGTLFHHSMAPAPALASVRFHTLIFFNCSVVPQVEWKMKYIK